MISLPCTCLVCGDIMLMSGLFFSFSLFCPHVLGCLGTVVWFAMHDLVVVFSTLGNRHPSSPIDAQTTRRLHPDLTSQRRHGSGPSTWICFQRQPRVGGGQRGGGVGHGASLRLQLAREAAGVPGQRSRQHEADEALVSLLEAGELLHRHRRCQVLWQGVSFFCGYCVIIFFF